jgi:MFS family permease
MHSDTPADIPKVWFATFLTSIIVNLTAAKTKDRWIHITVLMLFSAIGNAVATGSTNTGARFFAMFLMAMGAISAYTILVGWVANSFPRPLVKRSSAIAIANMIGNCASIYGSYLYPQEDGPQYIPGGSANSVICLLTAALAMVLMFIHRHENSKLEKAEREGAENGTEAGPVGFRYIY